MRILLPDSGGWMEATGQLTWRSKSRRRPGIRFVGLPEEARQRIADCLPPKAQSANLSLKQRYSQDRNNIPRDAPTRTPMAVVGGSCWTPAPLPKKRVPELNLPEDSSVLTDQPRRFVAELFQQAHSSHIRQPDRDVCSTHLRERR